MFAPRDVENSGLLAYGQLLQLADRGSGEVYAFISVTELVPTKGGDSKNSFLLSLLGACEIGYKWPGRAGGMLASTLAGKA